LSRCIEALHGILERSIPDGSNDHAKLEAVSFTNMAFAGHNSLSAANASRAGGLSETMSEVA
jgi:hypothetical protein